jgi:hypothetical protein
MYEDLINQDTEWQLDEGALKILNDLQWQAILSFTIYLDTPIFGEHGYDEARQYILLILSVLRDIKSGKHSDDFDSIGKLEVQLENWEQFYENYYEGGDTRSPIQQEVDDILIQAELREDEDGE